MIQGVNDLSNFGEGPGNLAYNRLAAPLSCAVYTSFARSKNKVRMEACTVRVEV